jgi:putative sigma-54 modulation protein
MALKVDVYTRSIEVTERINDYVTKKVARLDRFLPDIEETRVDLAFNKSARNAADRHVAQITLRGKGYTLRAEEGSDDLFTAIDASLDKIERQIERYKGKRNRGRGDGTPASGVVIDETIAPEADFEEEAVIARRKKFVLVPMNEAEAIEQMNLLGQEHFFVFYNADTNAVNVLYRRRDGTFGLIEPQLG